MKYQELPIVWQRVFSLAWESLLHGRKAIAAVIVSDTGEIISEGRNRIAENDCPNYKILHAETEAIANLDIKKYLYPEKYTLYAGLEPCIMCFGTMVMGHVRNIVIAAKDGYGGAMELSNQEERKNFNGFQYDSSGICCGGKKVSGKRIYSAGDREWGRV